MLDSVYSFPPLLSSLFLNLILLHVLGWADSWGDLVFSIATTRQFVTLLKHIWALYQAFN